MYESTSENYTVYSPDDGVGFSLWGWDEDGQIIHSTESSSHIIVRIDQYILPNAGPIFSYIKNGLMFIDYLILLFII